MIKAQETTDPRSCLSRAYSNEMLFTLLARDQCAPDTIRAWVQMRIDRGLNSWDDVQIQEALACATVMEEQRKTGSYK